ncbi:MAG: TetR family transcriptional regulator [Elusimicrobia bacterium CG_4_10_14_0_8_um_filter_37_32]|nr:MAG: TetR family transcriptional regulator [Elusimicrobia bacterium CG02_land_8_20_14_3_00_37_13]PIZ14064.1 MAG: TetR family transcriptional regulator [Elusimicrobia bacterium CG_4_10_14_0_8_um_filter_37_32]
MEKSVEKKNILLQVAQGIFARFGLFKTSVDEIAKTARMGKSSIYYYFKSKEDIFKAVLEKELKTLREKIITAIAEAKSPQEKLRIFIITRMKYTKELANIYGALKDEYLRHYAFIQKLRANYDHEEINTVKNILQEGMKGRVFFIKDLELTSFAIGTAIKGLEYDWAIRVGEKELEETIDGLLEVLFYGITKR